MASYQYTLRLPGGESLLWRSRWERRSAVHDEFGEEELVDPVVVGELGVER